MEYDQRRYPRIAHLEIIAIYGHMFANDAEIVVRANGLPALAVTVVLKWRLV
jgi:hypothetical protein